MRKELFRFLKRDSFFLIASLLSYTVSAITTRFQQGRFDSWAFFAGILIFLSGYALKSLLDYLTSNRINPYARLSYDKKDKKYQLFLITIVLFAAFFTVVYYLLQKNLLIGVNLIYISILLFLFLMPLSRFGKIFFHSYDVLLEALIVSPLLFFLGSGLQSHNPGTKDLLLALPLFFFYIGTAIAYQFPDYDKDSKAAATSLLGQIGWENGIKMHNITLLLAWLSLMLYLIVTQTFALYLPILLISGISLFEIYLLNRISMGMKPNWGLLRTTAVLQFFSISYLLVLPML